MRKSLPHHFVVALLLVAGFASCVSSPARYRSAVVVPDNPNFQYVCTMLSGLIQAGHDEPPLALTHKQVLAIIVQVDKWKDSLFGLDMDDAKTVYRAIWAILNDGQRSLASIPTARPPQDTAFGSSISNEALKTGKSGARDKPADTDKVLTTQDYVNLYNDLMAQLKIL